MAADINFNLLLDPALSGMRRAVMDAYELGRSIGRSEAEVEIKARVAEALGFAARPSEMATAPPPPPSVPSPGQTIDAAKESDENTGSGRAPRGSVRPAVIECLDILGAATKEQIAKYTGINWNSIRGTLNGLRLEGLAKRDGELWSLNADRPHLRARMNMPLTPELAARLEQMADDGELEMSDEESDQNTEEAEQVSSQEQPATSGRDIFG